MARSSLSCARNRSMGRAREAMALGSRTTASRIRRKRGRRAGMGSTSTTDWGPFTAIVGRRRWNRTPDSTGGGQGDTTGRRFAASGRQARDRGEARRLNPDANRVEQEQGNHAREVEIRRQPARPSRQEVTSRVAGAGHGRSRGRSTNARGGKSAGGGGES